MSVGDRSQGVIFVLPCITHAGLRDSQLTTQISGQTMFRSVFRYVFLSGAVSGLISMYFLWDLVIGAIGFHLV